MRITTAREQFEMLTPWRTAATSGLPPAGEDGLKFDWQPSDLRSDGSRANLENGDWLHVTRHSRAHKGEPDIWEYNLYGSPVPHDPPGSTPRHDMAWWSSNPATGATGFMAQQLGSRTGIHGFTTKHEAMTEAERHYLSIMDSRRGQAPARDFSEYDDIGRAPHPSEPDEGFDIFGEGR